MFALYTVGCGHHDTSTDQSCIYTVRVLAHPQCATVPVETMSETQPPTSAPHRPYKKPGLGWPGTRPRGTLGAWWAWWAWLAGP